ncbi:YkuS family protein [Alkaliphilus pronyensis]|uniref:YkuS family protein n=1 Tax=Alkaliphilus pronyensis TaxID=1482732 RepID=A0A6I0EZ70_9FIRM|nr:YkuS family protein [Alkaliphilus pronyensis]KAB3531882.1 YkuS family protein [Alkaliphilus pronyensis]
MKKIAVQDGLEYLKEELEAIGYEIIDFTTGGFVDAIIYTDDYSGIEVFNNDTGGQNNGAILINARSKSTDEIIYIIEKRRYGGLFT